MATTRRVNNGYLVRLLQEEQLTVSPPFGTLAPASRHGKILLGFIADNVGVSAPSKGWVLDRVEHLSCR